MAKASWLAARIYLAESARELGDQGRYEESERALRDTIGELGGIDKAGGGLVRVFAESLAAWARFVLITDHDR
jgi:hypothetical protein